MSSDLVSKLLDAIVSTADGHDPVARSSAVLIEGLILWFVLEIATFFLVWLAGRTQSDLDDVLIRIARKPLRLVLIGMTVLRMLAPWSGTSLGAVLTYAIRIGLIVVVVASLERAVLQVLLRAARRWATRTETYVDDMLVPMAETMVRPIAICIGAVVVLQSLGLPVQAIALIVGGGSFVLAFALQSSLEDIFGGISMLVDSPFTYGDVLRLVDGNVCEVLSLGLRVTHLYNAADHSVISMPNRELASQRVINLSRPTPDMRLTIRISVDENSDMALVRERLLNAANAHPWVIGNTSDKLTAMRRRMRRLVWLHDLPGAAHVARSMEVVDAEGKLNAALDDLATHLVVFAGLAHRRDRGIESSTTDHAMDDCGRVLADKMEEVRRRLTCWIMILRRTYVLPNADTLGDLASQVWMNRLLEVGRPTQVLLDEVGIEIDAFCEAVHTRCAEYRRVIETHVDAAMRAGGDAGSTFCLLGRVSEPDLFFVLREQELLIKAAGFSSGIADNPNHGIGDLHEAEEFMQFFVEWNRKMKWLESRLHAALREAETQIGRRQDEQLYELRRWLTTDFKESSPDWKYPIATLMDVGEGLDYGLHVYVDNVKLSHFTRSVLTEHQLREEIVHLFRDLEPIIELSDPELRLTMKQFNHQFG